MGYIPLRSAHAAVAQLMLITGLPVLGCVSACCVVLLHGCLVVAKQPSLLRLVSEGRGSLPVGHAQTDGAEEETPMELRAV